MGDQITPEKAIAQWECSVDWIARGWDCLEEYTHDLSFREDLDALVAECGDETLTSRLAEADERFRRVTLESPLCVWHSLPQYRDIGENHIDLLFEHYDPVRQWYFFRWPPDCPFVVNSDTDTHQRKNYGLDFLAMSEGELKAAVCRHVEKMQQRVKWLPARSPYEPPSPTEGKKQFVEHLVFKLLDAARGLEHGRNYQITRFYPLARLCDDESGHDFVRAILMRVRNEVVASGRSPLIPLDDKLHCLNETIRQFVLSGGEKGTKWQDSVRSVCATLYDALQNLQPGRKRIWVHASRRRATDRELLLAERALSVCPEDVIALFLTSYEDYRYHLLDDAAERLRWIAAYWCRSVFDQELDAFVAERHGQPPPPKRKRPLSLRQLRRQRGERFGALRKAAVTSEEVVIPTVPLGFPLEPPPAFELLPETVARLDALSLTLRGDDERDYLDDAVEAKLARAHYNLVKSWRIFRNNGDLGQVATRLKGAKNRCCEAWLYRNGQPAEDTDTRDYLMSRFAEQAPRALLRKTIVLEEKLTELLYCRANNDQHGFAPCISPEIRRSELAACLTETLALYDHLRSGAALPLFRWERENDFGPGQWVLRLAKTLIGLDKQGLDLGCQGSTPFQVVNVNAKDVVLRRGGDSALQRLFVDSLFLWPTTLREDVASPIEQRRAWFDPRPQLRQIPLELPKFAGIGKSIDHACNFEAALYETCPCCGYPIIDMLRKNRQGGRKECEPDNPCLICDWIVTDTQTTIRGQENFGYTLAEARNNFLAYGTMFGPDDGKECYDSQSTATNELKSSLCNVFDAMVGERNHGKLFLLWWQAEALRHRLLLVKGGQAETLQAGSWIEGLIDKECLLITVYCSQASGSIILRLRNPQGINRESVWGWTTTLPRRPINVWTDFFARRTWFERYPEFLDEKLLCSCCACPTLTRRAVFEACSLCDWIDNGQDDHNADQVLAGHNGDYSLTEARKKFVETLSGVQGKGESPRSSSDEQCHHGIRQEPLLRLYHKLMTAETLTEAEALWREIDSYRHERSC